jgi:hypothetical protein
LNASASDAIIADVSKMLPAKRPAQRISCAIPSSCCAGSKTCWKLKKWR